MKDKQGNYVPIGHEWGNSKESDARVNQERKDYKSKHNPSGYRNSGYQNSGSTNKTYNSK